MSTQHNTSVALTSEITVKALKSVCLVFADIRKLLADVSWRHLNENISVQSHTAISSSHYNLSLENYVYNTLFSLTRSNRTAIRALGTVMNGSTTLVISVHNRWYYTVTVNWRGHWGMSHLQFTASPSLPESLLSYGHVGSLFVVHKPRDCVWIRSSLHAYMKAISGALLHRVKNTRLSCAQRCLQSLCFEL